MCHLMSRKTSLALKIVYGIVYGQKKSLFNSAASKNNVNEAPHPRNHHYQSHPSCSGEITHKTPLRLLVDSPGQARKTMTRTRQTKGSTSSEASPFRLSRRSKSPIGLREDGLCFCTIGNKIAGNVQQHAIHA